MDIEILLADITDADDILALQKLAYQSEAELYQEWSIPPLTQSIEEIKTEFSTKTFFKACLDGKLVGSVRVSFNRGTCFVGRLIVHPEHQKKGIGIKLMETIEKIFPSTERFELFTGSRSESNIHLYKKLGYRIFRKERLSAKVILVYMEKLRRIIA
jgi:ribosomal protein S18 acetylase RimI-like enzyme